MSDRHRGSLHQDAWHGTAADLASRGFLAVYPAAFGNDPSVTQWEIAHGAGGGTEIVSFRVDNPALLWQQALTLISPGIP